MTRFLDQLTRMVVFLSPGLALPVVFLSSLVIFPLVAVGMTAYITYQSHYVLNSMILPILHIVIYATRQIYINSHQHSPHKFEYLAVERNQASLPARREVILSKVIWSMTKDMNFHLMVVAKNRKVKARVAISWCDVCTLMSGGR